MRTICFRFSCCKYCTGCKHATQLSHRVQSTVSYAWIVLQVSKETCQATIRQVGRGCWCYSFALAVHECAIEAVAEHEKFEIYKIYIARTQSVYGQFSLRRIYEAT